MKKSLFTIVLTLIAIIAKGQIYNYSSSEVKYDYVESVEEMTPQEIKMYNIFLPILAHDNDAAVLMVNSVLAQWNLMDAPSTIIQMGQFNDITDQDSLPQYLGAIKMSVLIENTSPKTIKEITLYYKFYIDDTQAYNIKDGSEYCIVKFKNIKGRSNSNNIFKVQGSLLKTMFVGDVKRGILVKPFYNKKANMYTLDKVIIKYDDGSTSNKAALFSGESLFQEGPLKPFIKALHKSK